VSHVYAHPNIIFCRSSPQQHRERTVQSSQLAQSSGRRDRTCTQRHSTVYLGEVSIFLCQSTSLLCQHVHSLSKIPQSGHVHGSQTNVFLIRLRQKWSLLQRWTGQFCRFTSAQKKSLSTKNRSRFESVLLKGVGVAYLGDRCFPSYGRSHGFVSLVTVHNVGGRKVTESGAQGNETVITYGRRSDSSFRHLASFKSLVGIKCCK